MEYGEKMLRHLHFSIFIGEYVRVRVVHPEIFKHSITNSLTFSVLRVTAQTHHHPETGHEWARSHDRDGQEFVHFGYCRSVLQRHAYYNTRERLLCRELQW